jgi:hypothetical protein
MSTNAILLTWTTTFPLRTTNRNRPFRQFLADQMDVYIYTQDEGTGEKQIMWSSLHFSLLFNSLVHTYYLI